MVVAEIGLITPPAGMNIFIIKSQFPELPLGTLFRGIVPFLLADAVLVALLLLLPAVTAWLPRVFYG